MSDTLQNQLRQAADNKALDIGTAWNLLDDAADALDALHARVAALEQELTQLAASPEFARPYHPTPPAGAVAKCLVCAQEKPWGLWSARTGEAVCEDCKNAPALLAQTQHILADHNRQWDIAREVYQQAEARVTRLAEALRQVEWVYRPGEDLFQCPWCREEWEAYTRDEEMTHAPDCPRQAALAGEEPR